MNGQDGERHNQEPANEENHEDPLAVPNGQDIEFEIVDMGLLGEDIPLANQNQAEQALQIDHQFLDIAYKLHDIPEASIEESSQSKSINLSKSIGVPLDAQNNVLDGMQQA